MVCMSIQKFYRKPWTKEKVDYLTEFWPHFGTWGMAKLIQDISRPQIKSKAFKIGLYLLPKDERLCFRCRIGHQVSRDYGLLCKDCALSKRKDMRSSIVYGFDDWMQEVARTCRYRTKKFNMTSDITGDFLKELWAKQNGICIYSGIQMILPEFGKQRNPFSASLDRKDSNFGYRKDNVVWCCWACNCGKSDFRLLDYIKVCKSVASMQTDSNNSIFDE
jgi:hypothetical protein